MNPISVVQNIPRTIESAAFLDPVFIEMVKEYTDQANKQPYSKIALSDLPSYKAIKDANANEKKNWLFFAAQIVVSIVLEYRNTYFSSWGFSADVPVETYMRFRVANSLQESLLTGSLPISPDELASLIHLYADGISTSYYGGNGFPVQALIKQAEQKCKGQSVPDNLKDALKRLLVPDEDYPYIVREHKVNNQKIEMLLYGITDVPVDLSDAWGKEVAEWLLTLTPAEKKVWVALLEHCIAGGIKSAPTAKWKNQAEKLLVPLDHNLIIQKMQNWLQTNIVLLKQAHKGEHWTRGYLRDVNMHALKGLIWCCALPGEKMLQSSLLEYANIAYKKKPGVGPLSVSGGSACMYTFSKLPFKEGVPLLVAVRNKTDNKSILKTLNNLIEDAALENNISLESIEEIAAPAFGMQSVGVLQIVIGEYTACLKVQSSFAMELIFEKDGKVQTNVPSWIKQHKAVELKAIKATQKAIEEQLKAHTIRLESYYLNPRQWTFSEWEALYVQHPLLGIIGHKLIWHFETSGIKQQGIFEKGQLVDVTGAVLQGLNEHTKVQLWHPIGFEPEYVLAWRNYFRNRQIVQPFKQAFREVYIVTDAELRTFSYSNRFAAHILRQHQFAALARQRGWHYTLMGNWDSHNTPVKLLPHWKIVAEFFVDADWNGTTADSGVFAYISTDQVRFKKEGIALSMSEIPAMAFTEIMRDVDLFVGVCSVGNDQAWTDGGDQRLNTYWHEYSFSELGESAKLRMETLQFLIPKMKIAEQCSFDKKFLFVQGRLCRYKIHMGSGNILMEPNDQYLCIVPGGRDKSTDKLFLPFEGDTMLSIILSKALLLAEDYKITDGTIVRQLPKNGSLPA